MRLNALCFVIVGVLALLTRTTAYTATPVDPTVPPDYPGVLENGSVLSIASVQMGTAPVAFYKMYGRWPASWQEVRDAGLVQVDLTAATGEQISPDDGNLDFVRDRVYEPPRFPGEPAVQEVQFPSSAKQYDYVTPVTYDELITSHMPEFNYLVGDIERYRQFALAATINAGIQAFQLVHGRFPTDFDEFLGSRIGSIDYSSINPLTGDRFYGDGRPNDYLYVIRNETLAEVVPTDENGDTPWHFSM